MSAITFWVVMIIYNRLTTYFKLSILGTNLLLTRLIAPEPRGEHLPELPRAPHGQQPITQRRRIRRSFHFILLLALIYQFCFFFFFFFF